MRYALPLALLTVFVLTAAGCGRTPAQQSATIGEAVEVKDDTRPEANALVAESPASAAEYTVTDESYFGWAGRKPLGTHYGQFPSFEGAVTLIGDDVATARADVTFHMGDLSSDDTRLTGVLHDSTWFHTSEHPIARFVTTSIEPAEEGYMVTGNLEIRGVNKSITFPAEITLEGDTLTVLGEFNIDRTAWEIGRGHVEDLVVRNDVAIEMEVIAKRTSSDAPAGAGT